MDASTLTEDNLIALLGDAQQRGRLEKAMRREQDSYPLLERYEEVAVRCIATSEQLHTVVKALLPYRRRYERLIGSLVFHPQMSEPTLLLLCERSYCITALGHRGGPQKLLERVVAKYRYSEAITTLALSYYSKPEYPIEAFTAFLREHADDWMLRGNILRAANLPWDRRQIAEELFAESDQTCTEGMSPE